MRRVLRLTAVLLLTSLQSFGVSGSFRGTLIGTPAKHGKARFILVKSKNGQTRHVDISKAKVVYEETVPDTDRKKTPEASLTPGIDVRVTGELDAQGEWRASEVEIVGPDQPADDEEGMPDPREERDPDLRKT